MCMCCNVVGKGLYQVPACVLVLMDTQGSGVMCV